MAYDRGMGPLVRGWSPPFTPSGMSSIWRIKGPGYTGVQMAHMGVLVRFEADAERLATLLPAPLEASERTGEVGMFVNVTRSVPRGFADDSEERRVAKPFHEVVLIFPCRLGDTEYQFHWIMYTDDEWAAYTGFIGGMMAKLAEFDVSPLRPPHPGTGFQEGGAAFDAVVTRAHRPLISLRFRPTERVSPETVFADAASIIGMRYMPDLANDSEDRPLVHDLVIARMKDPWHAPDAWAGDVELELGDHPTEELEYFAPRKILSAHYIDGFGYHNLGREVLYDYLSDR